MANSMSEFLNDLVSESVEIMQTDTLPENQNYKRDSPRTLRWLRSLIGYNAGYFNIQQAINKLGVDTIFEDMSHEPSISGYIERMEPGWRIAVNRYENPGRQRFTMAHELAHLLFHRDLVNRKVSEDTGSKFSEAIKLFRDKENYKHEEMEANTFAAELLMPSNEFRSLWSSHNTVRLIAEHFNVSLYAAEYRAKKLGLPTKEL